MSDAHEVGAECPYGTNPHGGNTNGLKSEKIFRECRDDIEDNDIEDNECFIHPIGEKCSCNCKILDVFSIFGKKHTLPIIRILLLKGVLRFNEIARYIKSNPRTLSTRLKELERKGLVTRKVYNEMPLRVEYSLTEAGRDLRPIFKKINEWANRWVKNSKSSPI